jgi:predicted nucleic acid-binding protein
MVKVQVVVTDANILINLIHVGRLSILGSLPQFEFVVPDEVVAEILIEEQAAALRAAIDAGHLACVGFQDTEELTAFAALASFLGMGESACLALAQQRGWWVASDEGGAFRREAQQRLGPNRIVNTPGLLLSAIRAGVLTVEEADHAKAVLEQHRFRVRFKSFRSMLES